MMSPISPHPAASRPEPPVTDTHRSAFPIPNMRLYILDRNLSPLPIGVSGELYVGGIGVGRGYLHDPLRTAEAFRG